MDNSQLNQLPIGVFDSGVGGLTVLKSLQTHLPNESFIYLGDTARLPYGTKSPQTIIDYSLQAGQTLINQGIKLLVVACNTASTLALPSLIKAFPDLPIIGVLEPGAEAACSQTESGHIAVIATHATIQSGGYQAAIKRLRPTSTITAKSCQLFVALAEEAWVDGSIAEAITSDYLLPLFNQDQKPDCLLLGCTHFPVLKHTIQKVLGDDIILVDSAEVTANTVECRLKHLNLENTAGKSKQTCRFLVTDSPRRFIDSAKIFLNSEIKLEQIQLVDSQSYQ